MSMETFKFVPREVLSLIPKYDGTENLLNLFIAKSEYVIKEFRVEGNTAQNLYLFHAITSRLVGKAATLLSENQNITSWDHFKDILTQHFGDPRSEECIAIELESLKIKSGESYIEFCQRIQSVKSSLTSKVNRLTDESIKAAKLIIYNNTALNVFLYNLSEDLLRIVRLKGCTNLESALSVVTEEVNFHYQYSIKNKLWKNSASPQQNNFKPGIPSQNNFKPGISPQNNLASNVPPQNNFKYGIPPQNNLKYGIPPQNHVKFGMPTQNNFKFGIPPQNNFKFGIPPQNNFKFGMPRKIIIGLEFRLKIIVDSVYLNKTINLVTSHSRVLDSVYHTKNRIHNQVTQTFLCEPRR
ncbi:unnamed protein product [Pieris macdunnoughi]|uniref:Retrotransposon gag domain-containing protein n=1 Tax=Pieris macdunnoughi TaxID=345717 RepID=A0A821LBH9_9NEOP|nr:unnamed protein product [Pieris macdunnoughi]